MLAWSFFVISACGSGQSVLPTKYDFPELAVVSVALDRVALDFDRQMIQVDERSLAVPSLTGSNWHLLILRSPSATRVLECPRSRLSFGPLGGSLVFICGSERPIPVSRTYRLADREQMLEISTRLQALIDSEQGTVGS